MIIYLRRRQIKEGADYWRAITAGQEDVIHDGRLTRGSCNDAGVVLLSWQDSEGRSSFEEPGSERENLSKNAEW